MNSTATGTQFVVNSLLKSSRPGKSSLIVSLPAFPENEKLCAHSTLLHFCKWREVVMRNESIGR